MDAVLHPRAAADEKARLVEDFIYLCEIESPSRRERLMADAVTAQLRELGLEVEEDASGAEELAAPALEAERASGRFQGSDPAPSTR